MRKEKLTAESISIKSPCSESWDEMSGNEKTRACSHCEMNVNDISMMTEADAFGLIDESNGNLCVRYESHPVTNAPIFADKLYQITRQTGVTAGVLGATLAVSTAAYGQESAKTSYSKVSATSVTKIDQPNTRVNNRQPKVSPTPPKKPIRVMGKIAIRRTPTKPLLVAVNRGSALKVRLMIAKGVDVNTVDTGYYSRTALHLAMERNNLKIAQMLLNAGTDLEMRDIYANTPIMAIRGNTSGQIIQLIAKYGADLNAINKSGQTALMEATRYSNLSAVKALVEAGADVTVKDFYGNSALDFARSEPIKDILIAYGATKKTDK